MPSLQTSINNWRRDNNHHFSYQSPQYQPLLTNTLNTIDTWVSPHYKSPQTFNPDCLTCHAWAHQQQELQQQQVQVQQQQRPYRDNVDEEANTPIAMASNAAPPPHHGHQHHPSPSDCLTCHASKKRARHTDWLLVCLAVLCPPAVAYIKTGSRDLCLNVLLSLFGWGPGILHAWYLILLHPGVHHRRQRSGQGSAEAFGFNKRSFDEDPEAYAATAGPGPVHLRDHDDSQQARGQRTPAGASTAGSAAGAGGAGSVAGNGGEAGLPSVMAERTAGSEFWRDSKDGKGLRDGSGMMPPPSYAVSS